ncbi:hypothetical protein SU69_03010 [Thermosipho melanesiensis]|uniref:Cyclic nucleotide-binding protein n=2 Tax=Thermosipho melanesiensis TaxID=46541 RepID=A6LKK4_THEM4|nr:hypothetical protein [Thermosipho melanesiensis]ABR30455.1 hypothetical protein Tmel_0588 [Thermosipho melanesiensis BI429]APT73615.1 hypothetical protein BW47_03135 [Thermosipho melanesiensis]OOC37562.1 hypothetical protein SU68_03030 [Thermosipho melanesiensis]OOC39458.1 hypothetical protein SU69_03010 [Thermosipho melanesiensis]OOC39521.1 hypothetical protein SU70_03010 [Thermosipho melanesiensis]
MKIQGIIFTVNEVPRKLYKIKSGKVREMKKSGPVMLEPGDFVALPEYLLEIPLTGDVSAIEESEIEEVSLTDEFENILSRLVFLRKTKINNNSFSLEDFLIEDEDLDNVINHMETLLSLSVGELPDDEEAAMHLIENIDESKLLTKVNYIKNFIKKFPNSKIGAELILDTAKKVYSTIGDRYITKLLCKKLLLHYSDNLEACHNALNLLALVYKEEGNIMWIFYSELSKYVEVKQNENS